MKLGVIVFGVSGGLALLKELIPPDIVILVEESNPELDKEFYMSSSTYSKDIVDDLEISLRDAFYFIFQRLIYLPLLVIDSHIKHLIRLRYIFSFTYHHL